MVPKIVKSNTLKDISITQVVISLAFSTLRVPHSLLPLPSDMVIRAKPQFGVNIL